MLPTGTVIQESTVPLFWNDGAISTGFFISIKEDEIAILFSPYPIVDDIGDSIFQQPATDFLKAIFK